jgi:hypothetical protein
MVASRQCRIDRHFAVHMVEVERCVRVSTPAHEFV